MKNLFIYCSIFIACFITAQFQALSQTLRIVSNVRSGSWSDATIWSTNQVPLAGDVVFLTSDIAINVDGSCQSLNTNGYNVIISAGVKLSISGAPYTAEKDSLSIFDLPSAPGTETLQATSTISGIEYFFFGHRDESNNLKIARSQFRLANLKDTVVNFYYNSGMDVKTLYYTFNGVKDTSFYKYTYLDSAVIISRFRINWETNSILLREAVAIKRNKSLYTSIGISQLNVDFLDKLILDVGIASSSSVIAAAGILAAVGLVAVVGYGVISASAAAWIAVGGAAAFGVLLSNAHAGETGYDQIQIPIQTAQQYNSLIQQNALLNNSTWYGSLGPFVTTTDLKIVTPTKVNASGALLSEGGTPVLVQGVCWTTNSSQPPTTNDSKQQIVAGAKLFSIDVDALLPNTNYFFRTFASNSNGTSYGQTKLVRTGIEEVTIGTQTWMVRNLDVTHYRNGDPIPQVTDDTQWSNLTTGAWCYYENNTEHGVTYGKLYNWYAVNDPRGLAPIGWHIPTDGEWTTLTNYLGGLSVAGGKMKAVSPLWNAGNTGATNSSGFTALPGGFRYNAGPFDRRESFGLWWSSTINNPWDVYYRYIRSEQTVVIRSTIFKAYGKSVRCIKD